MSLKQTVGKGAKARYDLGNDFQGTKRAVSTTPKHDRHCLSLITKVEINKGEDKKKIMLNPC